MEDDMDIKKNTLNPNKEITIRVIVNIFILIILTYSVFEKYKTINTSTLELSLFVILISAIFIFIGTTTYSIYKHIKK